jgi:hypothetical protein
MPNMTVEAAKIARQCRQYAMCKIDFLGNGICPAALEKPYVSYFPQGRMLLYQAITEGKVPLTERLVNIVRSCTLCGVCDVQCYFITELRPLDVMRALHAWLEDRLRTHDPLPSPRDETLNRLEAIVGGEWVSSDPAILVSYAHDPCPASSETMPRFVVLPKTAQEVSAVLKVCKEEGIPYAVRGNGASVMGFVLSPGLVLDMNRMKGITVDPENACAHVEAGVTSHELQQAVNDSGYYANTAEPAACVCANLMSSGLFSLFSHAHGTGADHYIDAEFVDPGGRIYSLSERDAPNLFGFARESRKAPGVCTRATIRLHPKTGDEQGLAVPFEGLQEALAYARELGSRRIGLAVGVIGIEYLATFIAPTSALAQKARHVFSETLGIGYVVLVLGDRYGLHAAADLAPMVIDASLLRTLTLGLPNLVKGEWQDLLSGMEGERPAFELLADEDLRPMLEATLRASPKTFSETIAPDLRPFFEDLYARPEMTDMFWLNLFRIVSSRMGREGHVVAFIVYVPLDKGPLIEELVIALKSTAEKHHVRGEYGFLTPLDEGKRGILEFDYYLDHTDPEQRKSMLCAMEASTRMIERFMDENPEFLWINYVFNQGYSRKEGFLYHTANIRSA